jgi:hypothetical protein
MIYLRILQILKGLEISKFNKSKFFEIYFRVLEEQQQESELEERFRDRLTAIKSSHFMMIKLIAIILIMLIGKNV